MEKIAVIGLSCLFPNAFTPMQFWQNLIAGKDSKSSATDQEMGMDPALFYNPIRGKVDKSYYQKGGYIRDFTFESSGYKLPNSFLDSLDDLFKWSLYVAKQALEDSGYARDESILSRCGVIMGHLCLPTKSSYKLLAPLYHRAIEPALKELLHLEQLRLSTEVSSVSPYNALIAGYPTAVIAQSLGLAGINFSLDAACASSLYAVKLACQYLLTHQADLMLAGAVSCAHPLFLNAGFAIFQAFPENGISQPLSKSSGGLTTGEGAGMLVLKRHADALRDGDRIYATICGVGLSNDGRGKHLLSPNPRGQSLAFERAYAEAGVSPQSIAYVECHATGTPLGDITELNSMDAFFGRYGASPLVGSVKSNFGHLLTAAGMTSIIKVILSMSHGMIPSTIGVTDPLSSQDHVIGAEQIVRSTTLWPNLGTTKRAAVSAFGFGGTNAHLILEQEFSAPAVAQAQVKPDGDERIAIVGMDAHFGTIEGLDNFDRTVYEGTQHFIPVPPQRWKGIEKEQALLKDYGFAAGETPLGAYIKDFKIDVLQTKIPPNEAGDLNPQQLLMLKVANNALRDAGMTEGANVATIVAMGTELSLHRPLSRFNLSWQLKAALENVGQNLEPELLMDLETLVKESLHNGVQLHEYVSMIGNVIASRISALWDFTGPAFTLSTEENSTFKALEIAKILLNTGQVEAVIVGAVDLAGGMESVCLHNQLAKINTGVPTLGLDRNANGWLVGEGAAAVVLRRYDTATQAGERIYAVLDAIALVQQTSPTPTGKSVVEACHAAFKQTGLEPAHIGYLEVSGSGIAAEDAAEINGLTEVYRQEGQASLTCALSSIKANIGHSWAAAGMASLVKTALCLYHRYIPATPGWSGPKQPEVWQGSLFYVASESRPWLLSPDASRRIAAINGLGVDGTFAHLILSEYPDQVEHHNRYLKSIDLHLFPIAGQDQVALLDQLKNLEHTLLEARTAADLANMAYQCFTTYQRQLDAPYVLAIVVRDVGELTREVQRAQKGVIEAFAQAKDWKTPAGSYFTTNPLGKKGSVAFVYPGAFNSYVGLGRDIFHLLPSSYPRLERFTTNPALLVHEQLLYPRSLESLSKLDLESYESQIYEDPIGMLESGMSFAVVFTALMRECFRVEPQTAFGYSLGETSMLYALGVWEGCDTSCAALHASPLFKSRLSGLKDVVRSYWEYQDEDLTTDLWTTYVLVCSESAVLEQLKTEPRVYLTHINTPEEVVIAGDPKGCLRVVENLACDFYQIPSSHVLHCEVMASQYEEFVKLSTLPIKPVPDICFYGAAKYQPLELNSVSIAHDVAQAVCQYLNFPQLIERVYEDGTRIFVELGPASTCSRWISETLTHHEHVAMSINRRGSDDHSSLIYVLAKLLSHRVALDLSLLYDQQPEGVMMSRSLVETITLGGCRIRETILSATNQARFKSFLPQISQLPEQKKSPTPIAQSIPVQPKIATTNFESVPDRLFLLAKNQADGQHNEQETNMTPRRASELPKAPLPKPATASSLSQLQYGLDTHHQQAQEQKLHVIYSPAGGAHAAFLRNRRQAIHQLSALIGLQINFAAGMVEQSFSTSTQPQFGNGVDSESPSVVWNEEDLLEFAVGRIGRIFGKEYEIIDKYERRVRLPGPPYLLVSRVTRLEAQRGSYKPCFLQTEYNIPYNAWYSVDSQIPLAVAAESGQSDLLLISYLGIDFENQGQRVYRVLNATLTFLNELPKEGQTLRYNIWITSFARSGDSLIFFFNYECFVEDQIILKLDGGCAGFFSDEELAQGRGVIRSDAEQHKRSQIRKQYFQPLLSCLKSNFQKPDLRDLTQGRMADCFGIQYEQNGLNSSLRLPPEVLLMIDRVVSIDQRGGAWGLGLVVAQKDLNPDDWYFPCHFKDDPVLPGSLVSEGCFQLLQFYMLFLGMHTCTTDARFQPLCSLPQSIQCRGQIQPAVSTLVFHLEVSALGLSPEPFAIGQIDVILDGKTVVSVQDLGVRLSEKVKLSR